MFEFIHWDEIITVNQDNKPILILHDIDADSIKINTLGPIPFSTVMAAMTEWEKHAEHYAQSREKGKEQWVNYMNGLLGY